MCLAPAIQSTRPYVPHPAASPYLLSTLTTETIRRMVLLLAAAPLSPPCRFYNAPPAMRRGDGKGGAFALGLILLPFIFVPILGFGQAVYTGPYRKWLENDYSRQAAE